jgi:hypothetical protein
MRAVIVWLWQLPQHVLALVIWGVLRLAGRVVTAQAQRVPPLNCVFIVTRTPGWGVSLGRYIFLDKCYGLEEYKHETGHSFQSRMMGPLYLLAVGLPSALGNNLWDRLMHRSWTYERRHRWYYSRYPEAWADRLGGVKRNW